MTQARVEHTVVVRVPSSLPRPNCPTGVCLALARPKCVCDGEWRMTLAPRPPVSNVWPRDLPR